MSERDERVPVRRLESMKGVLEKLAFFVVLAYFAAFAVSNADARVELRLWWGGEPFESRAFFPVVVAFAAGFLVATLFAALESLRRGAETRRHRRDLSALEAEVARLRNLPMEDDLGVPPAPPESDADVS